MSDERNRGRPEEQKETEPEEETRGVSTKQGNWKTPLIQSGVAIKMFAFARTAARRVPTTGRVAAANLNRTGKRTMGGGA